MNVTLIDKQIIVRDATVTFPDFDSHGRSIKKTIMKWMGSQGAQSLNLPLKGTTSNFSSGLFGINFSAFPGDRVAVVGKNGAGKSTFLRALTGVYEPNSGSVAVNGTIGSLLNIGMGTDELASGLENIYMKGLHLGLKLSEIDKFVPEIIEFSELGDAIYDPVKSYSSGMYMRLMFSVVTSIRRDIVVMDEWLSVGDTEFQHKSRERLLKFLDKSDIIVIASHSRQQLEEVCNRAILIENGRIVMDGEVSEVCETFWPS